MRGEKKEVENVKGGHYICIINAYKCDTFPSKHNTEKLTITGDLSELIFPRQSTSTHFVLFDMNTETKIRNFLLLVRDTINHKSRTSLIILFSSGHVGIIPKVTHKIHLYYYYYILLH